MRYHGPSPSNSKPQQRGVLLLNLGSPDSPEVEDVRRYLAEFLSDPRIVEMPRLLWWPILHGIILRTRPKRSAAAYRKIWSEDGSPLIAISRRQQEALQNELDQRSPGQFRVELAMRYGNPSIADGLERLRQANARRITVLPLYPQYSATTTGSTFDAVTATLRQWRWLPELHFNDHYHTNSDYIEALATSVRSYWQQHGEPEKLLLSFHGIPQEYADAGDPYQEECHATAKLLTAELGINPDRWQLSFQSRLGRQQWLQPYTSQTLQQWGRDGVKSLHVICPGFASDCLETLEEIAMENRAVFQQAGGGDYHYIPALNDDVAHIKLLANLVAL